MIYYHYIIIRENLSKSAQIVAATHSAGESIILNKELIDIDPLPVIHAVVLAVPDEASLLQVASQLQETKVKFRLIQEPDAPWNGQAMSIGIVPLVDRSILKQITGKLKLLK